MMLLFLGVFGVFLVVQRGAIASYDGKVMVGVGKAITHHRLSITRADDVYGTHTPYSSYGIGVSLVVAPLYALQQLFSVPHPLLVTLTNPLLLAAASLAVFKIGREIGWSDRLAAFTAVAFSTLTMSLQASTEVFSEPGVALGTGLVMLGSLRWRRATAGAPWLFGLGIAIAILFRFDSLLLLGLAVPLLVLFVPARALILQRGPLVKAALPILAALAWTSWYSHLRSGSWVPRQYGGQFSTPLLHGLNGFYATWGKGFFVFNPLLVLAIPGLVFLWRRDRALTVLSLAMVVTRSLFFARWSAWFGGVAWGPRFLMPLCLPLTIAAGATVEHLLGCCSRRRAAGLLVAAVACAMALTVNLASVWLGYEAAWNNSTNLHGATGAQASVILKRQSDGYYRSFAGSSVGFNLEHLHTRYWALRNFRGGPNLTGIAGLVLAAGGITGALACAGRRPRGRPNAARQTEPEVLAMK
jgi:4-amino-4-deoxy-L-arabinose transferase-like glycosyltransferase